MPAPLDCPATASLPALLAAISPNDQERYERHVETCPACQQQLAALEPFGEDFLQLARQRGDPTTLPPDPTLTQIMERLHGAHSPLRSTDEPADLYFLQPADRPSLLGTLGAYEVQAVIGQGGMGVVLKAFEPALHRLVAIKVLAPALAGSATARLRFTREAKAAAAVSHDHIVVVYGVHETAGLPYLVMEYIAGESLQERIDRTGPLELTEIVRIGLQTASGLAAAHAQGLIHRDIKPANLLLENGLARVTITDFGLARTVDDVQLTQNGAVAGTPEYMAPEQARGDAIDHRADLFSLGSVLYAMCTGVPPFAGSTALAVLRHVSDQTPPPVRSHNPAISAWLETLIARLMAKEPAERFASAAEVAALLEGYLAHLRQPATVAAPNLPGSSISVNAGKPRPRISTVRRLAAIAALVCVLGLLAAISRGGLGFRYAAGDPVPAQQPQAVDAAPGTLDPRHGLVCLLVNKNSGRCLSINGASDHPGAKIVQGPTPEQAGAAERWTLLGAGNTYRLRNESSRLVLAIGSANPAPGVQAMQWHDQPTATHQLWSFERVDEGYVLRVQHSQLVLGIGEASQDPGGRAVQWDYVPGVLEECWELRPAYPHEVHWSLKGDAENRPPTQWIGPDAGMCVRFEPDGLRLALPEGHPQVRDETGVRIPIAIKGDFVVTMNFEILQQPRPADTGLDTRVTLGVQTSENKAATISGTIHPDGRTRFSSWCSTQRDDTKELQRIHYSPTDAKTGRLRLVRGGPVVSYHVSTSADDDFIFLQKHPFGSEDVSEVRIVGTTGANSTLDVRITDLSIRAASLPNLAKAEAPVATTPPEADAPATPSRAWLLVASIITVLFVLTLATSLGAWLYARRCRRARLVQVSPALPDAPLQAAAATPAIAFACSSCGKHLKARAALAGKKVKCPQCGKPVLGSSAGPDQRGRTA